LSDGEKRILVVDDDDAIRALLLTVLRRRGYKVDTAHDGSEAIERSQECRYALILLDLMMPVKSGYDVLDYLEQLPDRPLVIVLTAGPVPKQLNADVVAGTLRKPFDLDLLLDTMRGCLSAVEDKAQGDGCPTADSDAPDQS
jgi:CheY-like chemotaxis protein